jgi:NADPH-dependent ferric siderophore reductase
MEDMDTNHRGGPPGFVRVVSNSPSGAVIVYPEYSGNRLYQTLGNLQTTPLAGLAIPDFDTGDVLYLTGTTEVLIHADAAALLPRSNLAVKITITESKFVEKGLAFKGVLGERSPYNPSVRYATTEKITPGTNLTPESTTRASLTQVTKLTPTISRFRFRISTPPSANSGPMSWQPGQYATLSFADDLDSGYSHMRDDDPKSLNDDYMRTFTVSSPPSSSSSDNEFDLTIRRVGRVTEYLFRQNARAGHEVPLRGFEGEFRFESKPPGSILPFIAGGIGITPVLGQLNSIPISQLKLLWTVNIVDIGLVADTFKTYPQLPAQTTLFITGEDADVDEEERTLLKEVGASGARVERRRLQKKDVEEVDGMGGIEEWYMCVGPRLKSNVLNWLSGKRVVYEDFGY